MRGRVLHVESSFNRKAGKTKGGVGIDEAVASAETRVAAMAEQAMSQIDLCLAEANVAARGLAAGEPDALLRLRTAADTLASLPGLFGMGGLSKAAASLCALLDSAGPRAAGEGVRVHLEAMLLFRHADAGVLAVSTEPVLQGLTRVSAHFGVPDQVDPAPPEPAAG